MHVMWFYQTHPSQSSCYKYWYSQGKDLEGICRSFPWEYQYFFPNQGGFFLDCAANMCIRRVIYWGMISPHESCVHRENELFLS